MVGTSHEPNRVMPQSTPAPIEPEDVPRLLLELAALSGWWLLGLSLAEGVPGWVLAFALVAVAGAAWGVFRVPGDPGDAVVPVQGRVRLALEWGVFLGALVGLARQLGGVAAVVLAALTVVHYLFAYERVRRLYRQ